MQDSETNETIEIKDIGNPPKEKKKYYNPEYKRNYYLMKKIREGKIQRESGFRLKRELNELIDIETLKRIEKQEKEIFENEDIIEKLRKENEECDKKLEGLQDYIYTQIESFLKLYIQQHGEDKIEMFERRFEEFDELWEFPKKLEYMTKLRDYLG
jgi:hypothetical protein